jgi:N-acylglucosamine-6-phosphate 2-epimerase
VDCTRRRLVEQEPWPKIVRDIHARLGRLVLADVASLEDAISAEAAGADVVSPTLYGYTDETQWAEKFFVASSICISP